MLQACQGDVHLENLLVSLWPAVWMSKAAPWELAPAVHALAPSLALQKPLQAALWSFTASTALTGRPKVIYNQLLVSPSLHPSPTPPPAPAPLSRTGHHSHGDLIILPPFT